MMDRELLLLVIMVVGLLPYLYSLYHRWVCRRVENTYAEVDYPLYIQLIDFIGRVMSYRRFNLTFDSIQGLQKPEVDLESFTIYFPAKYLYRTDYFALAWVAWQLAKFEIAQQPVGKSASRFYAWAKYSIRFILTVMVIAALVAIAGGESLLAGVFFTSVSLFVLIFVLIEYWLSSLLLKHYHMLLKDHLGVDVGELIIFENIASLWRSNLWLEYTEFFYWLIYFLDFRSLLRQN